MLVTEEQAKEIWCSEARLNSTEGTHNRYVDYTGSETPSGLCIGSNCMKWRWAAAPCEWRRYYHLDASRPTLDRTGPNVIDGKDWHYEHSSADEHGEFDLYYAVRPPDMTPTHGYCGLAGKPEAA